MYYARLAAAAGAILLLAACAERDVVVEEAPIRIVSEQEGYGKVAREGDMVTIEYDVRLPDGTIVLSEDEYYFTIGAGSIIQGVDEAVVGMRKGGVRRIDCPPNRHWGRKGYGEKIPPNTRLDITIKLHDVS